MVEMICVCSYREQLFSQIGLRWVVPIGTFPDGSPVLCDLQGNLYYQQIIQGVKFAFLVRLSRLNTYWKPEGLDVTAFKLMLDELIVYKEPCRVECPAFPVVPVENEPAEKETPLPIKRLSHIKKLKYA